MVGPTASSMDPAPCDSLDLRVTTDRYCDTIMAMQLAIATLEVWHVFVCNKAYCKRVVLAAHAVLWADKQESGTYNHMPIQPRKHCLE